MSARRNRKKSTMPPNPWRPTFQHEVDADIVFTAEEYEQRLDAMVAAIRAQFGEVPVITVGLRPSWLVALGPTNIESVSSAPFGSKL